MKKIAYAALDVHMNQCVLGMMKEDGSYLGERSIRTSETALSQAARQLGGACRLTLEEGCLSHWVASLVSPHVGEVIVCDPKQNWLISRSSRKDDRHDVHQLCRLLRLGELHGVYHSEDDERVLFRSITRHYLDMTHRVRQVKQSIKSRFRHFGVVEQMDRQRVFTPRNRPGYLEQLQAPLQRLQLEQLYDLLDAAVQLQEGAFQAMVKAGSRYGEVAEFQKIPGIGPVNSCVFSAFIITPHRFATRQQLWRYSKLGIAARSSDGKPLGYKRLDKAGKSELKAASYQTFLAAQHAADNEIRHYYRRRIATTGDRTHARLTTQRKILTTVWTIWKKEVPYDPAAFMIS